MSYSQFSFSQVKSNFQLHIIEGSCFFPNPIPTIQPSQTLISILEDVPWAIAVDTEKARSEAIISPVLLEIRRIFKHKISVFSGEEFNVDPSLGLTGVCDFLISCSPEQLAIEAPVIVLVEAKKSDLKGGVGQCIAEMIAAQRFNHQNNQNSSKLYGCITTGTQWRFLQLDGQTVTIDLCDYPLLPVENILGFFNWMINESLYERN
jgi:hypothetical protein